MDAKSRTGTHLYPEGRKPTRRQAFNASRDQREYTGCLQSLLLGPVTIPGLEGGGIPLAGAACPGPAVATPGIWGDFVADGKPIFGTAICCGTGMFGGAPAAEAKPASNVVAAALRIRM